jgi:hypothetical protein
MEPVFMILGHSAATAACMSIDGGHAVQALDYAVLQNRLLADGQVLAYRTEQDAYFDQLAGVVVDDNEAAFRGKWSSSSATKPHIKDGYHHNGNVGDEGIDATFHAKLKPGRYEVRLAYSPNANRAGNVPVAIKHRDGTTMVTVDQRKKPTIEGRFVSLGVYDFASQGSVTIGTEDTDGHVIADAAQFVPQ